MSDDRRPAAASAGAEGQGGGNEKVKWWRRPVTWIAGLAGALILAMVTALGTGIGNSILTVSRERLHTGGPPVAIEQVGQIQTWQDYSFVIPGKVILTPAQLAAMNEQATTSESAYANWFLRRGGVIANRGVIGITVRGNASGPVTITDMEVVKHCGPPLAHATLFYSPSTGAGPFSTSQIGFDLGQPVTIGQYIPAPGPHALSAGGNFFAKEVITLKPGEPRTLSAFVTAEDQDCSFIFQLHVATPNGPSVIENVTDNGKPFQITSDGETGPSGQSSGVPFSSYSIVYAGGAANLQNGAYGPFTLVNPATYKGAGRPAPPSVIPVPTPPASPSPSPPAQSSGGVWIAQLASVPVTSGISQLQQTLSKVQRNIPEAQYLESSSYASLTPGYWVVFYRGPFSDGNQALSYCAAHGLTTANQCIGRFLSHSAADSVYMCFPPPRNLASRCNRE